MEWFSIVFALAVASLFFWLFKAKPRTNSGGGLERAERLERVAGPDLPRVQTHSPHPTLGLGATSMSPTRPQSMTQPEWKLLKPNLNLFCNEMSSATVLSFSPSSRSPMRVFSSITCKIRDSPVDFVLQQHGSLRVDMKRGSNEAVLHFSSLIPGDYKIEINPSQDLSFDCVVTVSPFSPSRANSVVRSIRSTAAPMLWTDVAAIWLKSDEGAVLRPSYSVARGHLRAQVATALDPTASRTDWCFRYPTNGEIYGTELEAPSFVLVARPSLEAATLGNQGVIYSVLLGNATLTPTPLKMRVPSSNAESIISSSLDMYESHRAGAHQTFHLPLTAVPDPSWSLSAFAIETSGESHRLKCFRTESRFEIDFCGQSAGHTKIFFQLCPPSENNLIDISLRDDHDPDNWFLTEADLGSDQWDTKILQAQKQAVLALAIDPQLQLPGSPLLLTVTPSKVSPTHSRAFGVGLTSDGVVQPRRTFYLALRDDFGNSILGPAEKKALPIDIYIYDALDREVRHRLYKDGDKMCVEYEARTAGQYSVSLSSDEKPFPGTPFVFNLLPLPLFDASNSSVMLASSGRKAGTVAALSAIAGSDFKHEIDLCDKYGNAVTVFQTALVECVKADFAGQTAQLLSVSSTIEKPANIATTTFDPRTQKHYVLLNQTSAGRYEVSVRDPQSGEHIKHSPFTVVFTAAALEPQNSYIEVDKETSSEEELRVGVSQSLRVQFRDRYGNVVSVPRNCVEIVIRSHVENLDYQASIQGHSLRDYRDDCFDLSTKADDSSWTLSLTPLTVGEFEFFIRVRANNGTVRTVLLREKRDVRNQSSRIKVVPGVTSALFSSVSSNGFESVIAGITHEVEFAARDMNGQPKITGGDPFRVQLVPLQTSFSRLPDPSEYSSAISDLQNGSYKLTIIANKAGKYDAHIFLGQQEILGSPITVHVSGGPPSNVYLADSNVGLPDKIVAGEIVKFPIRCEDSFGNATYASADRISITFETASAVVTPDDVTAHIESIRLPDHSISYLVAFGCIKSMTAGISVRATGDASGTSVNWKVAISTETVSLCEIMELPSTFDADTAQRLCVRFRLLDKFKNIVSALENTSNLEFHLRQIKEDGATVTKMSGLALAEDATASFATFCLTTIGEYQLSIVLKGISLASKKFSVVPGRPNPNCCVASKLPRVIASGTPQTGFGFNNSFSPAVSPEYSFTVNIFDSYQNSAPSSRLNISWSHAANLAAPTTAVRSQGANSFLISFKINAPGKYLLAVTVEGAHIAGSPFPLNAMPHLPDFASKRKWLAREIMGYNSSGAVGPRIGFGGLFARPALGFGGGATFNLSGNTPDVLLNESLETILRMDDVTLKGHWKVNFKNSEAVDGGGVFRSWASDLMRYILDANFALFMPCKDRPELFLPSPASSIHARHLAWFKAIGRFVGKMASRNADSGDPVFLPGGFTDGFLAEILGISDPIGSTFLEEMRSFDMELHKQLKNLLDMSDVDDLGLSWDVVIDNFGEKLVVELVPNGKNMEVTDANKKDYVEKTCEMKLRRQAVAQVAAFREGFLQVFPLDGLAVLEPADLALLIFGKTAPLDIPALRNVVRVAAVGMAPNCLEWFWQIMQHDLDEAQQRAMLKFWTGLEREPVSGWRELQPPPGIQFKQGVGAPTAATCSKVLKLPAGLPDKATLKKMIVEFCIPQNDKWGLT
eukprot:TRINITY_DN5778_c0_g1_i1.p1 TRINITY_DN5778_c0_g1~~TRINITY_DN5778_c0_g1_i1.p1  ORF type:complete len:1687 (+),score=227.34 TRINITY_DN5778_c0_g1_i1:174-5234(+)